MGFGKKTKSASTLVEEVTLSRFAMIEGAFESMPVVKDIVFRLSDNKRWYNGVIEDFEPTEGFLLEVLGGRFDARDRDISLYFGGKSSNAVVIKLYSDAKPFRQMLADCETTEDVLAVLSKIFHDHSDDIKSLACYFPATEL